MIDVERINRAITDLHEECTHRMEELGVCCEEQQCEACYIPIALDALEKAEKYQSSEKIMTDEEASCILQRMIDENGLYGIPKLTDDAVKAIMIGIEALHDRDHYSKQIQ